MFQQDPAALAERKVVSDGILEFSIDLLKTLHEEDKNLIFSPLSISLALSLAYLGAAGSTREEIGKLLRGPTEDVKIAEFHKTICNIMESVFVDDERSPCGGAIVTLANAIFMQERLNVKPSYLNDATTLYKSEVTNVNFEGDGTAALAKINGWVSEKTKDRIPQLFKSPLSSDTLVLLVNTLYFCSSWYPKFQVGATKLEKFFTGKEEIMAHMMNYIHHIPYTDNKSLKFQAISLKYSHWGYKMCIILPNADQSLDNVINQLKHEDIQAILGERDEPKIDYKIPRFKFSSSLSLKDTLSKLGMLEAFTKANFSNMMDESACVADVAHAAEIEVDEKGTKATAATAVIMERKCGRFYRPSEPIKFYANRPFLAFVYHLPTSTILFSASVYQPTGSPVPQN